MKTTVLLPLFLLFAGLNSAFAQIKEGDLLISRTEHSKLKNELASCRHKASLLDSLERAFHLLISENELLLYSFAQKLDKSEQKVIALQADNRKMHLSLQDQKAKTNEYRFAYIRSGRFKERAQISTVWAAIMSVGFILSAGENYTAAYVLGGGSAAITLFLAIKAGQATKIGSGL